MSDKSLTLTEQVSFSAKLQDYMLLTKFRLSGLVVFSAAMGFIIAAGSGFSWTRLGILVFGGFLVAGASNGFNQVIEKDLDKLMDRTANRPLPSGRMNVSEALMASMLMGISGVGILWLAINPLWSFKLAISSHLRFYLHTVQKADTIFSLYWCNSGSISTFTWLDSLYRRSWA